MNYCREFGCLLFAACIFFVSCGPALASSALVREIQDKLYSGQTSKAASIAKARLKDVPSDDNARFALGAVQFLQAVEQLGQSLHRYGLQSTYKDQYGLTGLPILRLPVPDNPNPDELTYEAFRNILKTFIADLAAAEATLSEIKSHDVHLPLNIGLIRLDLNGDGQGTEAEALWRIFAAVTNAERWLDEEAAQKLLTDFDGSDVPWLQAYCHLLMAIAEFPLAHDWQRAFEMTFPGIFHMPGSKQQKLFEVLAVARGRLAETATNPPLPPGEPKRTPDMSYLEWSKKYQEWTNSAEYQEWKRKTDRLRRLRDRYKRKDESRLAYAQIADLISFLHLIQWPVSETHRMTNVLRHLEAMVGLSRQNWKRILAESDNRNEWIPSPAQTGVLPGIEVNQERVDGWQEFLNEFEAILKGNKLIPHWRFDEGINLRRMFLEPRTFDIVLLVQGSAALPYLEKGPVADQQTWRQIMDVFGGDFFRYFIWFN